MPAQPSPPSSPRAETGAPEQRAGFRHPYTVYVMSVLFLVYVISYVDRQVLAVLIDPIKQEIGASDGQMGILAGIAFALFYATLGMPIARFADHHSRRNVIAVGVAVWSAMTALTGFARNYFEILLARIFVGVGEAAGGAPGHSIISDYFPPSQRATALALYTSGGTAGIALGLYLGGLFGDWYGWRATFVILGLPGLLVSLLVWLTVREPPRGRFDTGPPPADTSMLNSLRYLWSLPAYRWLCFAAALHVFAGYGAATWHPSFLRRIHEMSGSEVGLWLGGIAALTSAVGNLLWARLADVMGQRDARWYMWLPMTGTLLALPFAYAFILIPNKIMALLCLVPSSLLGASYLGATYAMAQALARPNMRATSAASLLLVINLIGMGMGPTIVGFMNDWLQPRFGIEAVRVSLLVIGAPHLAAALFNGLAARTLRADLLRAGPD